MLLALGLLLGLMAGAFGTGSATSHDGPTWIFFPWVPNGNMLGTSGPFHGSVTIQNLENQAVTVYYQTTDNGVFVNLLAWKSFVLPAFGSRSLNAEELGVPAGGSGVMVTARTVVGSDPARVAGVQEQAAPEPLDTEELPIALGLEARTSAAHQTVGGYTGLTDQEIGMYVVLPIVQTNTGWNTFIRVTNFEDGPGEQNIDIALYPAGGGAAEAVYTSVDIAAGETGTINLLDHVPSGWVGSAQIEAPVTIGAIAERVKAETHMLIINSAKAPEGLTGNQTAPLVLNNWNSWNTGISIVNLSGSEGCNQNLVDG
jgi:hypothetical protein